MTKYTAEQVEGWPFCDGDTVAKMLKEYAADLRERESSPSYRAGISLYDILLDQWSRGFKTEQIISECRASGFVIDMAMVDGLFRLFEDKMERESLQFAMSTGGAAGQSVDRKERDATTVKDDMRRVAERIAASTHPENDELLNIAYAIARYLNLEGWPCAWEAAKGGVTDAMLNRATAAFNDGAPTFKIFSPDNIDSLRRALSAVLPMVGKVEVPKAVSELLIRLDACAECEQAPLAPLLSDAAAMIRKLTAAPTHTASEEK